MIKAKINTNILKVNAMPHIFLNLIVILNIYYSMMETVMIHNYV